MQEINNSVAGKLNYPAGLDPNQVQVVKITWSENNINQPSVLVQRDISEPTKLFIPAGIFKSVGTFKVVFEDPLSGKTSEEDINVTGVQYSSGNNTGSSSSCGCNRPASGTGSCGCNSSSSTDVRQFIETQRIFNQTIREFIDSNTNLDYCELMTMISDYKDDVNSLIGEVKNVDNQYDRLKRKNDEILLTYETFKLKVDRLDEDHNDIKALKRLTSNYAQYEKDIVAYLASSEALRKAFEDNSNYLESVKELIETTWPDELEAYKRKLDNRLSLIENIDLNISKYKSSIAKMISDLSSQIRDVTSWYNVNHEKLDEIIIWWSSFEPEWDQFKLDYASDQKTTLEEINALKKADKDLLIDFNKLDEKFKGYECKIADILKLAKTIAKYYNDTVAKLTKLEDDYIALEKRVCTVEKDVEKLTNWKNDNNNTMLFLDKVLHGLSESEKTDLVAKIRAMINK